jgi:hypothetical protein
MIMCRNGDRLRSDRLELRKRTPSSVWLQKGMHALMKGCEGYAQQHSPHEPEEKHLRNGQY